MRLCKSLSKVHSTSDEEVHSENEASIEEQSHKSKNLFRELCGILTKCLVDSNNKLEEQAYGIQPASVIVRPHVINKVRKWLDESNSSRTFLSTPEAKSINVDGPIIEEAQITTRANQSKMMRRYVESQKRKRISPFGCTSTTTRIPSME